MGHIPPREYLEELLEEGKLSSQAWEEVLEAAKILPSTQSWRQFLSEYALLYGWVLLLVGVFFWVAYNWQGLPRVAKLALPLVAFLCILWLLPFFSYSLVRTSLSLAAAIFWGAFLAVFGQVYQTGADSYELFLLWAAGAGPILLFHFSSALLSLLFLLFHVGVHLWLYQAIPQWFPWGLLGLFWLSVAFFLLPEYWPALELKAWARALALWAGFVQLGILLFPRLLARNLVDRTVVLLGLFSFALCLAAAFRKYYHRERYVSFSFYIFGVLLGIALYFHFSTSFIDNGGIHFFILTFLTLGALWGGLQLFVFHCQRGEGEKKEKVKHVGLRQEDGSHPEPQWRSWLQQFGVHLSASPSHRHVSTMPWYMILGVFVFLALSTFFCLGWIALLIEPREEAIFFGGACLLASVAGRWYLKKRRGVPEYLLSPGGFLACAVLLFGLALVMIGAFSVELEFFVLTLFGCSLLILLFFPDTLGSGIGGLALGVCLSIPWPETIFWLKWPLCLVGPLGWVWLCYREAKIRSVRPAMYWGALWGGFVWLCALAFVIDQFWFVEPYRMIPAWLLRLGAILGLIFFARRELERLSLHCHRLTLYASLLAFSLLMVQELGLLLATLFLLTSFARGLRSLFFLANLFFAFFLGKLYYSLELSLAVKAWLLMSSGMFLLIVRHLWLSSSPTLFWQGWFAVSRVSVIAFGGAFVYGLILAGGTVVKVYAYERVLREGEPLFLEIGRVDPRSLVQGDYVVLHYRLSDEVREKGIWKELLARPRGFLLLRLDSKKVGHFVRLVKDSEPRLPQKGPYRLVEYHLRYAGPSTVQRPVLVLGTPSFFCQEGMGRIYEERGRYAEFRLTPQGQLILVDLRDSSFHPIVLK